MQDINSQIGGKIQEARLKRAETLYSLASKLNVSHQIIHKYEKGQANISSQILYKIAQILDVPVAFFFTAIETEEKVTPIENPTISFKDQYHKKLNIFFIDDNPSDILICSNIFNSLENKPNIISINSAEKALELLKKETESLHSSIILLDLHMPGMDGFAFLRDIKKRKTLQDIPIIMMTSSMNKEDVRKSYRFGASGYICKSFGYDEFYKNLSILLDYWQKTMVLP